MNKFNLLFLLRARVLNSLRMKRRQVLLNESWSAPPFVKKDKSCVGGLTGGDCGTAGAVGQSVVSNCESWKNNWLYLSMRFVWSYQM